MSCELSAEFHYYDAAREGLRECSAQVKLLSCVSAVVSRVVPQDLETVGLPTEAA